MTTVAIDGQIRLAVKNDYAVVVRGIEAIFAERPDRFTVVREVPRTTLGERDGDEPHADVVLVDPFASGRPLAEWIPSATAKTAKHVVLSWHSPEGAVRQALDLGFDGYLSKTLPPAALLEAVEAVHGGEVVVRTDPPGHGGSAPGDWPAKELGLTVREFEILALVATGMTNAEICRRIYVGNESLKTHIRSAYRKLGVTRRSQAIVWWLQHELPGPPDG